MKMTRRITAVAAGVAALAVPATASAHEIDGDDPYAVASDGHYIVSVEWHFGDVECPVGYQCVTGGTVYCFWSDGTVDYCDYVPWWNW
jgi:hypothetical protein